MPSRFLPLHRISVWGFIALVSMTIVMFFLFSRITHSEQRYPELTSEEQAYLQAHGPIVFVSQTNYPPFESLQKDGSMDGICIELARWVATEFGFQARFLNMPFQEAQQAVLSGKADVITSLFYSDKRSEFFSFSEPLYDVPAYIFVKAERPDIVRLDDLRGKRIAIQRGDYAKEFLETKGISFELVSTENFAQATDAVLAGRADALIGDEQIVLYHLFSTKRSDQAKKIGAPLFTGKNCMAVKNGNTVLHSILSKSLKHARKEGVLDSIQRKWLGTSLMFHENPLFRWAPYLMAFIAAILLIAALFIVVTLRLRQLVKAKTEALVSSEKYYRKLIDQAADGIFVVELPAGRILDCNQQASVALGYSREELLAISPSDIVSDFTLRVEKAQSKLKPGKTLSYVGDLRRKDGTFFPAEVSIVVASDQGATLVIAVARDVSRRRQIESDLQKERQFQAVIIERVTEGLCVCQTIPDFPNVHFSVWNSRMTEITGYTMEEINRLGWYQTLYPDETMRNNAIAREKSMRLGDNVLREEWEIRRSDGQKRILSISTVVLNPSDAQSNVLAVMSDVTDSRRAERVLRESETLFRTLSSHVPVGIFQTGRDGMCVYVNNKWCQLTGMTEALAMGSGWLNALHPDDHDKVFTAWNEAVQTHQRFALEYRFLTPVGAVHWVSGVATALLSDEGQVTGYIGCITDITERRIKEEELRVAKELSEAANRAKSDFLANMSHEIRTPMNGIMGMAQLLETTVLDDEQKEYLDVIQSSSENLLSLINDVLDLSKIEAGKLELEQSDFSLRDSVNDVIKTQISRIHAKGLSITIDIPAEVPDNLSGDQLRLKQILLNLVSNAIKFTDKGGVAITVAILERYDDIILLRIDVADTGIGINSESIGKVFSPFSQADSSTTRKYGGTGLGLSICTRLLELMGGRIWVESSEGSGSIFHVVVPFTINQIKPEAPECIREICHPVWEGKPLRILLVEDHETNRRFIMRLLQKMGIDAECAQDGSAALAMWEQGRFDLILMDIQMPVMDGFEATAHIRLREEETDQHVPIIALTAHALREDRVKILNMGFDGYISKPMRIARLMDEITRCLPHML